jgi:hypothetical protein
MAKHKELPMAWQNVRFSRKGVFIVASLLILGFIGCISIPLGDPEKAKVDDKLLGAWITKPSEAGEQTLFTVVPYDSRTCLVTQLDFKKEGEKITPGGRLDWKMWTVDIKGTTFLSFEMKNPELALEPMTDVYASAKMKRESDTITIQTVKDDVVKNANISTSKQLEEMIAANLNSADLFNEPITLSKVKADQKDQIGKVLEAYRGAK